MDTAGDKKHLSEDRAALCAAVEEMDRLAARELEGDEDARLLLCEAVRHVAALCDLRRVVTGPEADAYPPIRTVLLEVTYDHERALLDRLLAAGSGPRPLLPYVARDVASQLRQDLACEAECTNEDGQVP
jgi:hypothetical protein